MNYIMDPENFPLEDVKKYIIDKFCIIDNKKS